MERRPVTLSTEVTTHHAIDDKFEVLAQAYRRATLKDRIARCTQPQRAIHTYWLRNTHEPIIYLVLQ
jgi:hypothetical protein